jgi:hypothetical protein
MYREPLPELPPSTPRIDRSYRRVFGEYYPDGLLFTNTVSVVPQIAVGLWLSRAAEDRPTGIAKAMFVVGVLMTLVSPFVWALLNRRQLEERWIREAIADEKAIAILVHGDPRRAHCYGDAPIDAQRVVSTVNVDEPLVTVP